MFYSLGYAILAGIIGLVWCAAGAFAMISDAQENTIIQVIERIDSPCPTDFPIEVSSCPTVIVQEKSKPNGAHYTLNFSDTTRMSLDQIGSQSLYTPGKEFFAILSESPNGEKEMLPQSINRTSGIFVLVFVFCIAVIALGRMQGLLSLVGMAFTFGVLIMFLANGILSGANIIVLTLISIAIMIPQMFYLTHGWNWKTHAAVIGVLCNMCFVTLFAWACISTLSLSGMSDEASGFLSLSLPFLDMKMILFAGIIIGILGVLDDIAVNQSAIVFRIASLNPQIPFSRLITESISIGKDHFAAIVNTLIIVYIGASFSLFLLFVQDGADILYLLSTEEIATEIVRMIVGTLGVLTTIPTTTIIAAYIAMRIQSFDTKITTSCCGHTH